MSVLSHFSLVSNKLTHKLLNPFYKISDKPVFILGNQKAGTTAIGSLFAYGCRLSSCVYIPELNHQTLRSIINGGKNFEDFLKTHKYAFSKELIKENQLTLLFDELKNHFPKASFFMVVRDPRDNIRSILNRMGYLNSVAKLSLIETELYEWEQVIHNTICEADDINFIEASCNRWNHIIQIFLENRESIHVIRYEDFKKDKVGTIKKMGEQINKKIINDIRPRADIQFQPKGNSNVTWRDFFGDHYLSIIESMCKSNMLALGYNI